MPVSNTAKPNRNFVAVASQKGILVDQPLSAASELLIFTQRGNSFFLVDGRATPDLGHSDTRWQKLATLLSDCRALLVTDIGAVPRKILEAFGIQVVLTHGHIQRLLPLTFQDKPFSTLRANSIPCGAGAACVGPGLM